MAEFLGFPSRGKTAPIPAVFFTEILPAISDLAELKVTLHVLWRISERRVYPRFITSAELDTDRTLLASLSAGGPPLQELRRGLKLALARGTVLEVEVERPGGRERVYFVNSDNDRRAVDLLERGELQLGQTAARLTPLPKHDVRPNVFAMYEQNIGLLTPMIADELRAAEADYPADWFEDAFRIAVAANRRNWRYISRILERWRTEGKDDGAARKDHARDSWDRYVHPEKWVTRG